VQPRSQEFLTRSADEAAPDLVAEVLRRFGHVRIRAFGGSMSPALRPGDVLAVHRVTADDLDRGDIVLFRRDGRLFAHRVIGSTQAGTMTRGDAHRRDDPVVPPEDVLGVVRAVTRAGNVVPVRKPTAFNREGTKARSTRRFLARAFRVLRDFVPSVAPTSSARPLRGLD
jgi:signal peptidase I